MSSSLAFKIILSLSFFTIFCTAIDTITPNKTLSDGEILICQDETFELGFFSPGTSKKRYLGVWFKRTPDVVAWVANRDSPILDSHGVLTLSSNGTLFLQNQTGHVIWYANSSKEANPRAPVAKLLNTGNLVLLDTSGPDPDNFLWQSFEHPTDTRLPGIKVGRNPETGLDQHLTSWKSSDDPSEGEYTYRIDDHALPELILDKGSTKYWRSGPWNGKRFSGLPLYFNSTLPPKLVINDDKSYTVYDAYRSNFYQRTTVDQAGFIIKYTLDQRYNDWTLVIRVPRDPCDEYAQCGVNSICKDKRMPICECLEGFIPKSPQDWNMLSFDDGCTRAVPLGCQNGDGFLRIDQVKLPELTHYSIKSSMTSEECAAECLRNCSCTAYSEFNIEGRGSGCLIWFGDLIDLREYIEQDDPQTIYVRLAASQLKSLKTSNKKKRLAKITVLSVLPAIFLIAAVIFSIWRKRKHNKGEFDSEEELELPLLEMISISAATNNFSRENLIGAGGFGSVYKGILPEGQAVAVKRLSKDSAQGLQEFKNEVKLIAKLQHKNLVRLLGCCIQGGERILIYEYMPNKSLDHFIFDHCNRWLLNWQKRYEIAMGIARGLLYLHQDSRLTIVHRDLKTSNILLDSDLKPKIADFGLARIFGGDQSEVRTNRVMGTYGYMSPEYAIDGKFSTKSDVFSFGVLLLELVSGKKNRGFRHSEHHHSLLGHAWMLFNEGNDMELTDSCLKGSCVEAQVLRCINVGLLCVQKSPDDRPAMSSVVFMLSKQEARLPRPKVPGFFVERGAGSTEQSSCTEYSENSLTATVVEPR